MLSSKNNFTIVIITFKSEKVMETCLNSTAWFKNHNLSRKRFGKLKVIKFL